FRAVHTVAAPPSVRTSRVDTYLYVVGQYAQLENQTLMRLLVDGAEVARVGGPATFGMIMIDQWNSDVAKGADLSGDKAGFVSAAISFFSARTLSASEEREQLDYYDTALVNKVPGPPSTLFLPRFGLPPGTYRPKGFPGFVIDRNDGASLEGGSGP
ncbi:MAG: hypothetical protein ACRENE_01130, partial [Polyangiaceae bacterium]